MYFENQAGATAPAQEVLVTDFLDPAVDPFSFRLIEAAWGDQVLAGAEPGGQVHLRQTVTDYRTDVEENWWVDFTSFVVPQTGGVKWTFLTLDTMTGALPDDPLAAFLPPNDDTGRGEGHVRFAIEAHPDTPDGTTVTNAATIVFDVEQAITTNWVTNEVGRFRRGDANTDYTIDAGDISALVLEIFDNDGALPEAAPGGDFICNPVGCDSNADGILDAGDISCTILTIFNGPGACGA